MGFSAVCGWLMLSGIYAQVEERLRFYEEGVAPRKNTDVMKDAISKLKETIGEPSKDKKKDKKDKVRTLAALRCTVGGMCTGAHSLALAVA